MKKKTNQILTFRGLAEFRNNKLLKIRKDFIVNFKIEFR